MIVGFGKYPDSSVSSIVIKQPDYVQWMFRKTDANGRMLSVIAEAKGLIAKFNARPFKKKCGGCGQQAKRCTVYGPNVSAPYWWCDDCDEYQSGANAGKLFSIHTYEDAVRHVDTFCPRKKEDLRSLIRSMATAKGMPTRIGDKQLSEFFS